MTTATATVAASARHAAPLPPNADRAHAQDRLPVAGGEFLTFRLGAEEYGVEILRVQEIRSYTAPTRIANAPAYMKGVINLRGVIVPIVDLRIKLGCDSAEFNAMTVVVVMNVAERVIGVVVDSVSDVHALGADSIKPPPELAGAVDTSYITGIGCFDTGEGARTLLLADIEKLLDDIDFAATVS